MKVGDHLLWYYQQLKMTLTLKSINWLVPHAIVVHWIRDCSLTHYDDKQLSTWTSLLAVFTIHEMWWCLLRWSDVKAKAKSQIGSKVSNGRWNLPEFLPTSLWQSHQSRFCANAIISVVGIQNSSLTDFSGKFLNVYSSPQHSIFRPYPRVVITLILIPHNSWNRCLIIRFVIIIIARASPVVDSMHTRNARYTNTCS